jgi:hypothetical protein
MNTVRTPNKGMASATVTKRWLVAAVFVVGAISAPMFLDTALAHADTPDPGSGKANCEAAGGTHSTAGPVTSCCFKVTINSAGDHCFNYIDDEMIGTNIVTQPPTSTNPHPWPPRGVAVPPAAAPIRAAVL